MIGVGEVISFFLGAFIGRYFEEIRDVFKKITKDVQELRN